MTFPARAQRASVIPILLTLCLLSSWIVRFSPTGVILAYHLDADVYRSGAAAVLEGSSLYGQLFTVRDAVLPFTYPPLAALLFLPLAFLPVEVAGVILTALSLLALWFVLALTLRALGCDWRWAVWLLPIAALFEPVRDTIAFGQINLLLMALVVMDALGRRRLSTGALAGLAAAVKLTPAVFVLYFLLRRDYRAAAVMGGTAAVATLAVGAIMPNTSWLYFTDVLGDTGRIGSPAYSKNQSIAGLLARVTDAGWADYVWIVGVAVVIGAAFLAARRTWVRDDSALLLSVVAVVSLLCSPVSWSHHWVWLIVLALATAARLPVAALCTVVLAILPPHALLRHDNGVESRWTLFEHLLGNSFVILAATVLAIVAAGHGARRIRVDTQLLSVSLGRSRSAAATHSEGVLRDPGESAEGSPSSPTPES